MSETCPLLTMLTLKSHMFTWDADSQIEVRCRTGLPVPNVNLEVVDTNGTPVPHGGISVGEVVVRTPWLTQGYVGDDGVIPKYGMPDRVEIIETIAKTSVGKISKKQLRLDYQ